MGCEPGTAEAFEWLGLTWADRWLTEAGASTSTLAAVHRLAAVDDLRGVDLAGEAVRYGLMGSFLLHALLVRGDCVDLTRSGAVCRSGSWPRFPSTAATPSGRLAVRGRANRMGRAAGITRT
jgi:hypothetical protein